MTTADSILYDKIYPALMDRVPEIFPEFNFKRSGSNWLSQSKRDLDGSQCQPGKVCVYPQGKHPYRLYSHRLGEGQSFWQYLAERQGIHPDDKAAVLAYLAEQAGVDRAADSQRPQPMKGIDPAILKTAHQYMITALESEEGSQVRAYLTEHRGYTPDDIAAMRLGFLPSRSALQQHLEDEGHSSARVGYFLRQLPKGVGESHQLFIPVFGRYERLNGFCFRRTDAGERKYLFNKGLDKSTALFDFPYSTTELVLVEGVLDAAIAKARGVNAVPLCGTGLNEETLRQLNDAGINSVIAVLDGDKAGKSGTRKITEQILTHAPTMRLRVLSLPEGTDPDDVIREQGDAHFKTLISHAEGVGAYYGRLLASKAATPLTAAGRDRFLAKCAGFEARLSYPPDLLDFRQAITPALATQNLTVEGYAATMAMLARQSQRG